MLGALDIKEVLEKYEDIFISVLPIYSEEKDSDEVWYIKVEAILVRDEIEFSFKIETESWETLDRFNDLELDMMDQLDIDTPMRRWECSARFKLGDCGYDSYPRKTESKEDFENWIEEVLKVHKEKSIEVIDKYGSVHLCYINVKRVERPVRVNSLDSR